MAKSGFHITLNHFYSPIPDTKDLKNRDLWDRDAEMPGINMNEDGQLNLLLTFFANFKEEYDKFPYDKTSTPYEYYVNNDGFESVDGEILYCMICHFKPRKIFEIGSGNSTYLSAQAVLKNNKNTELIIFDPYPNGTLRRGFPGLSKLEITKIENVDLARFKELVENDILFIDSSHVLKIGSDVQYLYLEVLPRLNKGVIVHIHDIFMPAEYKKEWVLKDYIFFTEQYLLQAFLTFNDSFEVLWAASYMHMKHPDKLEASFSSYKRNERWPGSFWIRKIRVNPSFSNANPMFYLKIH
ncbi:class I SAM-dependent methyltransferase [bacterium]|nr:class I SAM-dependent methyltransferase [bacterium]